MNRNDLIACMSEIDRGYKHFWSQRGTPPPPVSGTEVMGRVELGALRNESVSLDHLTRAISTPYRIGNVGGGWYEYELVHNGESCFYEGDIRPMKAICAGYRKCRNPFTIRKWVYDQDAELAGEMFVDRPHLDWYRDEEIWVWSQYFKPGFIASVFTTDPWKVETKAGRGAKLFDN